MRVLIIGAGNLLLSDEGFGVHCLRHLQHTYSWPAEVTLLDAGTLGLLVTPYLEEADRVYLLDALDVSGEPGAPLWFSKENIVSRSLIKLSPHQAGLQEAVLMAELRGRCPAEINLLGVIPVTMEPGTELSSAVQRRVPEMAQVLVHELRDLGIAVTARLGVAA